MTTPQPLAAPGPTPLSVFVSYAREDGSARVRLAEALEAEGLRVLGDWILEQGPDFKEQLVALIQQADVVVALVSPDFAASSVSREEIETAVEYGKRILAIVVRDVEDVSPLPAAVRKPQWGFLRSDAEFRANLELFVRSVHTDFNELRLHRDLLLSAERWEAGARDAALLLRGTFLTRAADWVAESGSRGERWFPKPTANQIAFVEVSARTERRRRISTALVTLGALIVAAVAAFMIANRSRAATEQERGRLEQERIQTSRRLALAAQQTAMTYPRDLELRVLLAAESLKLAPVAESDAVLRESAPLLQRELSNTTFSDNERLVAFSDDGVLMVTAGSDSVVRVYESASGKQLSTHRVLSPVHDIALSLDRTVLATAGENEYEVHELKTGVSRLRLGRSGMRPRDSPGVLVVNAPDEPDTIALSRNGDYVAVANGRGVTVYDTRTGRAMIDRHPEGGVYGFFFSPNGKLLATRGVSSSIDEVATGKPAYLVDYIVSEWAFSPDGRMLAVGNSNDSTLRLIDLTNGREVARQQVGSIAAVLFNPSGTSLAVVRNDAVRLFKMPGLADAYSFKIDDSPRFVRFNPDSTLLAITSHQQTSRIFELGHGTLATLIGHGATVAGTTFAQNGNFLAVAGTDKSQTLSQYHMPSYRFLPYRTERDLYGFNYSPARDLFAIEHEAGRLGIYEAATGRQITSLTHNGRITAVAFTNDGSVLAAGTGDNTVRLYDLAEQKQIRAVAQPAPFGWIALNGTGTLVATAGNDHHARVHDVETGRLLLDIVHKDEVGFVAFSSDGRFVASSSNDGTARVYEMGTSRLVLTVGHTDYVNSLAFSPDGRLLASVSDDETSLIHEIASGALVAKIRHADAVWSAAFSPDGTQFATFDRDNSVRVYAVPDWDLKHIIRVPDETWVVFAGNGLLMTAWQSGDKLEIRQHVLRSGDLVAQACARLTRNLNEGEWEQHFAGQPRRPTCANVKRQ